MVDALTRWEAKVDLSAPDGCWEWQAYRNGNGYGMFHMPSPTAKRGSQMYLAHRVGYELLVESVPEGFELDHLCRNRACVNPDHLEVVTHRENIIRGDVAAIWGARGACSQGHPYDEPNTYRRSDGSRICRACQREACRRHWAKHAPTHCPRGHSLDGSNLVMAGRARRCRACLAEQGRRLGQANRKVS